VYLTARRLLDSGYDRHEVLHMLAGAMAEQIHAALAGTGGYDRDRHLAALSALPESWERQRHDERWLRESRLNGGGAASPPALARRVQA